MSTGRFSLLSPSELRFLMDHALPKDVSLHGEAPDPGNVYLPASHAKALRPNTMVVEGMRGAGKSFWWAALQQPPIRELVAKLSPVAELKDPIEVAVGFGETHKPDEYPDRDMLKQLLLQGSDPRLIWKTVIVHKLSGTGDPLRRMNLWQERYTWVRDNPEQVGRLLEAQDKEYDEKSTWFIVLFDALDRAADNWENMYILIRGLLETALEFRPYRRLRVKAFLRSDQLDESRVANFADGSKVLSSKIVLSWPPHDLYGLFWQYLGNAAVDEAGQFREASAALGLRWEGVDIGKRTIWRVVPQVIHEETLQREVFHAITGPWMGRDHRRGYPYTWIPNHLSDANQRVSPRSFLAALREAVEDSQNQPSKHETALYYEGIKRGVRKASQIRVRELKEDYPWVDVLMEPLRGLVVPCDFHEVVQRWEKEDSLDELRRRFGESGEELAPAHLDEGAPGVREDLEQLGIFYRMSDGRVHIPDVYRIGYGMGRKGGVKPVRPRDGG